MKPKHYHLVAERPALPEPFRPVDFSKEQDRADYLRALVLALAFLFLVGCLQGLQKWAEQDYTDSQKPATELAKPHPHASR